MGHNSRAVHQAYAKAGVAVCPSLEDYEHTLSQRIVAFPLPKAPAGFSQLNGTPDEDVVAAREQLNQVYDRFVAHLGPISVRANTSAFRDDPDLPLLLSLEHYDEETGRATKVAIFRERTIQRHRTVQAVRTAQEALLVTLNERGCVDLDYLSSLLHRKPSEFLPGMLGLCTGLIWSNGWLMALLIPLLLAFLFMLTAWTYCLRGWLVSLMVNPRRRRAIVVGMTLAVILVSQAPNLYFNVMRNPDRSGRHSSAQQDQPSRKHQTHKDKLALPPAFLSAHRFVPPMWVAGGAMGLASGNAWPALGGLLACGLIGTLGLWHAYRSTVRFYQGGTARKLAPARQEQPSGVTAQRSFLESRVPGVSEETTAMALAFFRSMTRAPEVKKALAVNVIMPVMFTGLIFSSGPGATGESVKPLLATGAVAFSFFGMIQVLFNQFGFDRDGFRALVLLPVNRRRILLAKNLAFLPMGAGIGLIILTLIAVAVRLPPLPLLAACGQLLAMLLLGCMAGNLVSVIAPHRIAVGSLKPTKVPAKTMLLIFVSSLIFPLVMIPVFIPPGLGLLADTLGWCPAGPVNLLLSLLGMVVVGWVYWLSLEGMGNLLHRREKEILQKVTHEIE